MKHSVKPLQTLEEKRLHAAVTSGGISNDAIYNRVLEIIQELELSGRVIDYGAGVGNLTRKLCALGGFEQITGADILPRPQDLPGEISWHCLDLNNQLVIPSASFDAVIAAEVIEHLENPRQVVRELHRLLKPGGTLILTTPNNESIRSLVALMIRGHYAGFGDDSYPAHITALLRKDLTRILGETGFSGVRFYFTNVGGVPRAPQFSWQQLSFGLLKGCRFSDNVLISAVK